MKLDKVKSPREERAEEASVILNPVFEIVKRAQQVLTILEKNTAGNSNELAEVDRLTKELGDSVRGFSHYLTPHYERASIYRRDADDAHEQLQVIWKELVESVMNSEL